MGRPLVEGGFDFGLGGSAPTHRDLLDWLAAELVESGWSMKHLHRLIVNSATYRMESKSSRVAANLRIDPDNRYWWRRDVMRLESQAVRDSILYYAGHLDRQRGGPPISRQQQATSARRSLYFMHSLNDRNRFLVAFDEALPKECYQRQRSVVPQQALAMLNSKLVSDAAPRIASRLTGVAASEEGFIRAAFATLLVIEPSEEEMAASREALGRWRSLKGENADSARVHFIRTLINHNDFVTVR